MEENILGRHLRILAYLREAEPEAPSRYEIGHALGLTYRQVVPYVEDLCDWGFAKLEKTHDGKREVHLHSLTRAGREVADDAIKLAVGAKRHREAHQKAKKTHE